MSTEELRFSEYCANCRKSLGDLERILFVEKEVGRCFCCEECIYEYFQPTVDSMHEELARLRSTNDFTEPDHLRLAHYRQIVLDDPDEVWMEEMETGERRYTFISHFRQSDDRMSYIAVILAIDGVPSFVFLSFPTIDEDLVDEYRRGADLRINEEKIEPPTHDEADLDRSAGPGVEKAELSDLERLHEETRQSGDIPKEFFARFDSFVDPTLDEPDEIWRYVDEQGHEWWTFIAKHVVSDEDEELSAEFEEFAMIVVCEASTESLEAVFAFPTIDPGLVQHFRKGFNSLNKAFGVGWARGRAA